MKAEATTIRPTRVKRPKPTLLERKLAYMLRAAVLDAQRVEGLPNMRLNMQIFVRHSGQICCVCLGGARAILGMGASKDVGWLEWPDRARRTAKAIDCMRIGLFSDAARIIAAKNRNTQLSEAKRVEASLLIKNTFDDRLGRSPFEVYLRVACILLGEGDPGPSDEQ
jgi:hypothetical protein